MEHKAYITGLGKYLPEEKVSNADLEKLMDTTDAWIQERTGIQERRFFTPGKESTATMGAEAAKQALERAGRRPEDIDLLLFSTLSPDYYFPGCGVLLQEMLGLKNIGCIDLRAQCSGFIYGLSVAQAYIKSGMAKRILLVCSEAQSTLMELSNRGRNVAVIFGDGAGAAVLEACTDDRGIADVQIHSEGQHAEMLYQPHPGTRLRPRLSSEMLQDGSLLPVMNGNAVFKHAVIRFEEVIRANLKQAGIGLEELNLLIPHQANLRISEFLRKQLGLAETQVYNNIQRYGNTTAASIPIALTEAWEEGRLKQGDWIQMAAFGSGFTWGGALMQW